MQVDTDSLTSPIGVGSCWRLGRAVARWLVAVGLVTAVSAATVGPVRAESPAEQPRSTDGARRATASDTSSLSAVPGDPVEWFYLTALGLALMAPVGYAVYRFASKESERRREASAADRMRDVLESADLAEIAETESDAPSEARLFAVERVEQSPVGRQATSERSTSGRICPECGERFPKSVTVCPTDATPLKSLRADDRAEAADDDVDRRRCPVCERRFEREAEYCYHDGTELVPDSAEALEFTPAVTVCSTCGWEGGHERRICPRDGTELVRVDPSTTDEPAPPVPFGLCPECGELAPPGESHCEEDGSVLTPVSRPSVAALPPEGVGPRRSVCRDCGEEFSGAAQFCAFDGSELVGVN
ncbi:MAG: hypothetical protein ABEL76_01785 [Bradymonadaceae bacterium]